MIQTEVNQLVDEVDRISKQAEFNTIKILDNLKSGETTNPGQANKTTTTVEANTLRIHIGANANQFIEVKIRNMGADSLGLKAGESVNLANQEGANSAITVLDKALNVVNRQRADLGAFQNRLEHSIKGTDIAAQNLQSSESQIRDTDIAKTMVGYVKDQILSQSTISMLAQANVRPQMVMKILE